MLENGQTESRAVLAGRVLHHQGDVLGRLEAESAERRSVKAGSPGVLRR